MGSLTLKACQENVEQMFSVEDAEILSAMKMLVHEAHIFPEPSGSAPLAVLFDQQRLRKLGKSVVLVVSGGNLSLKQLAPMLT